MPLAFTASPFLPGAGKPLRLAYFCLEGQLQRGGKAEINCFLRLFFFFFFFLQVLSHPRLRIPPNSNWEQILKCQGQLQSESLKVPGLNILVRLGEQGQRSCPPAVQIERGFQKIHLKRGPSFPQPQPQPSAAGFEGQVRRHP